MTPAAADVAASDIDPFSPEVLADPYPHHESLREAGPVVWLSRYRLWAMARHAEVRDALADWRTYSSAAGVGIQDARKEKLWRPLSILLETDPPLHDRTRRVMARIMSPAAMRRLREPFKRAAERMADALVERGRFDAVVDLAEAFPLEVFPEAVGLADEGRENLLPFSTMVFNSFGPANELFRSSIEKAEPVLAWIFVQCQRGALQPGGFGAQVYEALDAGEIDAEEAPILVRSFLTAGLDTTVNGIAHAIYAFATHPDQWQAMRSDRSLVRPAFDEVLRWESPVQTFFRTTTRNIEVADTRIPEGSKVLLFLGAANRDPRQWKAPDRFDVRRRALGHVAFGNGIHACVGQLVARLEAEVLFDALADRIAGFELHGTPERRLNNTLRCIGRMPVSVTPA
jgi:cytochrome P450